MVKNKKIMDYPDKDILDKLFVDKVYECCWCDKKFAYKKDDKIYSLEFSKKRKVKLYEWNDDKYKRAFCCENHLQYYKRLLERFDRIEARLKVFEDKLI